MRKILFGVLALSLVLGMGGIAWAAPVAPGQLYYVQAGGNPVAGGSLQNVNGAWVSGGLFAYDFIKDGSGNPLSIDYTGPDYQYVNSAVQSYGTNDQYFLSFCIEMTEWTPSNRGNLNKTDPVSPTDTTTTNAVWGGEPTSAGDPVSKATAWLYYSFVRDSFSSAFDYTTAGPASDVGILQETIWYLENELTSLSNSKFLSQVPAGYAGANYDPTEPIAFEATGVGDDRYDFYVWAVNAWQNSAELTKQLTKQQDYLVATAKFVGGTPQIPEPSAVLIWGFGALLIGLVRGRVR